LIDYFKRCSSSGDDRFFLCHPVPNVTDIGGETNQNQSKYWIFTRDYFSGQVS